MCGNGPAYHNRPPVLSNHFGLDTRWKNITVMQFSIVQYRKPPKHLPNELERYDNNHTISHICLSYDTIMVY